MKTFASEFQSISANYREAGEILSKLSQLDESQYTTLIESILSNRDCLGRIEQMNSRVLQLSKEWKKTQADKDSEAWDQVSRLADDALQQAVRLNQLCSITARKLQTAKDRLGAELMEIGKGSRFLKTAHPSKGNYPKFIDSMC